MRIAQVSPLYESVPPRLYGGTERVVSYLTEELVAQGHDVTLFASGDSLTAAKLVRCCPRALRLDGRCVDPIAHHIRMLELVASRAHEFDLIHYHIDYLHYPVSRRMDVPHVTTLHGRLDLPDLGPLYHEFTDVPLVSISDAQRQPIPWANWIGTVYHGLPLSMYVGCDTAGDYLAFIGRISPEKRLDRAIEIARRVGMPLKVAAKIDGADVDYFHDKIEPLMDDPLVEFVGEIGDRQKNEFLAHAAALLFPIDWPEPFGIVMIESMACGTPVIAWPHGSVPEVIDHGVTGYVVDSVGQATDAVVAAAEFDRRQCRAVFEKRFSSRRMARDYVTLYERLLDRGKTADRLSIVEARPI